MIGRPIRETHGDVMDQVAARSGVIRVSNGFRCPDTMSNGGTFTDAMGSTCGVRIVMGALEEAQDMAQIVADAQDERRSAGAAISRMIDAGNPSSNLSRSQRTIDRMGTLLTAAAGTRRIRLTEDELMPEAIDVDLAGKAVEIIAARRPESLYSGLNRDLGSDPAGLSPEDLEGDTYIKSLGLAVLTEVFSPDHPIAGQLDEIEKKRRGISDEISEIEANASESLASTIAQEIPKITEGLGDFFTVDGEGMRMGEAFASVKDGTLDSNTVERKPFSGGAPVTWYAWTGKIGKKDVVLDVYVDTDPNSPTRGRIFSFFSIDGKRIEPKKPGRGLVNVNKEVAWNLQQFFDDGYRPSIHGSHANFIRTVPEQEAKSPFEDLIRAELTIHDGSIAIADRLYGDRSIDMEERVLIRDAILDTMKSHGYKSAYGVDDGDIKVLKDQKEFNAWKQNPSGFVFAGGDFDEDEQERITRAVDYALRHYPAAWQEAIKKKGLIFFIDKKNKDRAYATTDKTHGFGMINIDSDMLKDDDAMATTMLHEMMHINQFFNKEVSEAEFIAFSRRISPDDAKVRLADMFPGHGYDKHEIAVPDDADMAYMFKIYEEKIGNRPFGTYEMSAVLMEMIFGTKQKFGGDMDMAALMIGILMDHGM